LIAHSVTKNDGGGQPRYDALMIAPKSILITGASSGIGAALAELYAKPGVRLALSGRDQSRLDAVCDKCRSAGATVVGTVIDIDDCDAVQQWLEASDEASPLDLVIANAGVSGGAAAGGESSAQARAIFRTNIDGVLNTVHPAAEMMQRRGAGQIAVMSSLASFRGYPGALAATGVEVSVICPGYVRSRMTDKNSFPMPMLMDADRAARIICRGLERNRPRIAFPWPVYAVAWLLGALPLRLIDPIMTRLPKKA
jgi:short-subunit dehydrogenase